MDAPDKEEVDPGRLLDGIRSMNITSADRKRLVDLYLGGLIRAIEPDSTPATPECYSASVIRALPSNLPQEVERPVRGNAKVRPSGKRQLPAKMLGAV